MAWLFIDTHTRGEFRVGWLFAKRAPQVKTYQGQTQRLLSHVMNCLTRVSKRAWVGVCVVAGPGSFSAVRLGVLDANLLARVCQKPLVGVSVDQAQDLTQLTTLLTEGAMATSTYVSPEYDAEPNITVPRIALA